MARIRMGKGWKSILIVTAFFCFIIACKHESNLPVPSTTGTTQNTGTQNIDTGICFERDILPIFLTNCAKGGCHDAGAHEEGYILDSYSNIMNTGEEDGIRPFDAAHSELYEVLVEDDIDKRMPEDSEPLPAEQISLIKRWINEGAQNGTNCIVLCDTNNFTYTLGVKPILEQNCVGCHNNTLSNDGVNLSTFSGVLAVAQDGRLIGSVKHLSGFSFMPDGLPQLSDCKIRQIEKWIEAGAPEN